MAKHEAQYNKKGPSEPDAGVADAVARVRAQRAAQGATAAPAAFEPDAHYQAILGRVKAMHDTAAKANTERDAAATKAAKKAEK